MRLRTVPVAFVRFGRSRASLYAGQLISVSGQPVFFPFPWCIANLGHLASWRRS